jgi:hypothetical protein
MASLQLLNNMGGLGEVLESAPITQAALYAELGAAEEMVSLVGLGNKAFGSAMETITSNIFCCEKVKDVRGKTGWDLCVKDNHIELKSSRYWGRGENMVWRWQHVLPDHEWAYLMFAGIDIAQIRYFIVSKPQFMRLISSGIVTQQGGGGGQGCWFSSRDIIGKVHEFRVPEEINSSFTEQLDTFINENPASNDPVSTETIKKALDEGKVIKKAAKERKSIKG